MAHHDGVQEDRGRDGGFDAFFLASLPRLLGLARLLTGDRHRAEDLVQETFWRVERAWGTIEHRDAAGAYARTVMVRLAQRWSTRRWRGELPTEAPALEQLDPGCSDGGLDRVANADLVERALLALPVAQRAVVVLRFYDGYSEAEIAGLLGCSPGTVKSRCARALHALRTSGITLDEPVPVPNPTGGHDG